MFGRASTWLAGRSTAVAASKAGKSWYGKAASSSLSGASRFMGSKYAFPTMLGVGGFGAGAIAGGPGDRIQGGIGGAGLALSTGFGLRGAWRKGWTPQKNQFVMPNRSIFKGGRGPIGSFNAKKAFKPTWKGGLLGAGAVGGAVVMTNAMMRKQGFGMGSAYMPTNRGQMPGRYAMPMPQMGGGYAVLPSNRGF